MADLFALFGNDLVVGASGSLLTTTGFQQTQQRVIRRLLTNPGDYIFQPDYGAGLGLFVGQPVLDPMAIQTIAEQQMLLEPGVAQSPPPAASLTVDGSGTVYLAIQYTDADSGQEVDFTFPL